MFFLFFIYFSCPTCTFSFSNSSNSVPDTSYELQHSCLLQYLGRHKSREYQNPQFVIKYYYNLKYFIFSNKFIHLHFNLPKVKKGCNSKVEMYFLTHHSHCFRFLGCEMSHQG